MLTEEQTRNLKEQLIKHIENSFPEDRKHFAISQIETMDSEQLEEFLIKNKLLKKDESGKLHQEHCVFCSIVSGNIKAHKIGENADALAVLEINPVSRGHVLVIPKEHTPDYGKKPSSGTKKLIDKVSKMINKKLKPKGLTIENTNLFGHQIVNIIPNYESNELISPDSKRYQTTPKELSEVQKLLAKTEKASKAKPKKIKLDSEKIWLPKRIP